MGAVAVVISLMYLAIQLRVNSKTLKTNGSWNAEMSWAGLNDTAARDPIHSLLCSRSTAPNATLSDFNESEQAQLWFTFLTVFQTTQAQYFMWKDDCLSHEVWSYRLSWFRNYIMLPVVEEHWQQMKSQHLFSSSFIAEVELEKGHAHYVPSIEINRNE